MDKITFDFETETFTISDGDKEISGMLPGLIFRKADIYEAAGIIQLDLTEIKGLLEQLVNGEIDQEEFIEKSRMIFEDCLKSRFHDELN